jgi:hypothetical protein
MSTAALAEARTLDVVRPRKIVPSTGQFKFSRQREKAHPENGFATQQSNKLEATKLEPLMEDGCKYEQVVRSFLEMLHRGGDSNKIWDEAQLVQERLIRALNKSKGVDDSTAAKAFFLCIASVVSHWEKQFEKIE